MTSLLAAGALMRPSTADSAPRSMDGAARTRLRMWRRMAAVFTVYLGYSLVDLASQSPARIVLGAVLLVAFVWLYLGRLGRAVAVEDHRRARWMLAAMTAVAGAYLATAGAGGLLFAPYICISLVFLAPPPVSAPVVTAVSIALVVGPQYVPGWHIHGFSWGVAAPTALTSVAMYGLRANNHRSRELLAAREEIERLATEQERLRIARDLHDLLGHALTTVTLKAELASALATRDPQRAATEMAEVARLSRQGLADVRAAISGYREVTLAGELAAAREVLRAAGVGAELPGAVEDVDSDLQQLFGWVVREGVTNVVRHARARHVRIGVAERTIRIEDDGAGTASSTPGNGLSGLRERVTAAGGRLVAGPCHEGGWVLAVEVPA